VILVCAILVDNDWKWIPPTDERVAALSELLRLSPEHPVEGRGDKFRNPNGVARKMMDLLSHRPGYRGVPTHGGKVDLDVISDFLDDGVGMRLVAQRIRDEILRGQLTTALIADAGEDPDMIASEGTIVVASHLRRDRDHRLRQSKIAQAKARGERVSCEICGFDFERVCGERGRGYIESHHIVPLHVSGPTATRLDDLILICANCHRMIHHGKRWLTPDELRAAMAVATLSGRQPAGSAHEVITWSSTTPDQNPQQPPPTRYTVRRRHRPMPD